MFRCEKWGVTPSGHCSTASLNGFVRSTTAFFGGCKKFICCGDDLVADKGFNEERLALLGMRPRNVQHHVWETEFTSHRFIIPQHRAYFLNFEKMLWHLYHSAHHTETNPERFAGCLYVLRNCPEEAFLLKYLSDKHVEDATEYASKLMRDSYASVKNRLATPTVPAIGFVHQGNQQQAAGGDATSYAGFTDCGSDSLQGPCL